MFKSLLSVCVLCLLLAACGNKGPLRAPEATDVTEELKANAR